MPVKTEPTLDDALLARWGFLTPLQRAFFLPPLALTEAAVAFGNNSRDLLEKFVRDLAGSGNDADLTDPLIAALLEGALSQLSCQAAAWDRQCFAEFARMMRQD